MSERRGDEYEEGRHPPPQVDARTEEPPPPPPSPPHLPPPRRTIPSQKQKFRGHIRKHSQQVAAAIQYPNPVRKNSPTTIVRCSAILPSDPSHLNNTTPTAVAIGPYHHGSPQLLAMEAAKLDARDVFCRLASQKPEAIRGKILPLVETIRNCYDVLDKKLTSIDDGELSEMMLRDGCFLLLFMHKVVPIWHEATVMPLEDVVDTRMSAIARDMLLLENQIPWIVLKALMELGNLDGKKVVSKFLSRMATVFHVGSRTSTKPPPPAPPAASSTTSWKLHLWCKSWSRGRRDDDEEEDEEEEEEVKMEEEEGNEEQEPHHLMGLFYHRQVGKARTQRACLYVLPSLGSSAVELAEMGVKLTASKTRKFGDMEMRKHRRPLGLFGELSLAPVALNELTACWLLNMVAYEAFLGATQADNFAISSYVFLLAHLINREEDVKGLRARGIISSAMSDGETLHFFKSAAPSLHVGDRYIDISDRIHEYKQERWIWISIHRFLYDNIKIIIAVLSVIGVLTGLFKTMLTLKEPQR